MNLLTVDTQELRRPFYKRKPELLLFISYIALYIVITIFHEPWFDEAQAWQIAKYASFKDILLTVGHYEGHPFLWYFILALPAKLGVPFEWGLKSVGLLFSAASAWLILYKAPFPKIVRFFLPFSYFFFYQYGIIVRPYGLLLLLMILCAMVFSEKDTHPWRLVLLLMTLCALNAFGMVLAGGIAFCWCIDILGEYRHRFSLGAILRDRRFLPLCALLLFAILIVLTIYPYPDTYSGANDATNSRLVCFITALFTFIGDTLITTSPFFLQDRILLQKAAIDPLYVVVGGIIGLVLALVFLCYSSRKNIKYFLLPYLFFAVFSACVYFCLHHIGVLTTYWLFWCWINSGDPGRFETGRFLLAKLKTSDKDKKLCQRMGIAILCVCGAVSLYWSVGSSVLEIGCQYAAGRETAAFLKESGLDQLTVAAEWDEETLSDNEERNLENINTNLQGEAVEILAYFDANFIYTFRNGENVGYMAYLKANAEDNAAVLEECQKEGIPDVLIGDVDVELLTNGEATKEDYAPVYELCYNYILKAKRFPSYSYIYIRRDLLEEYSLEEIETPDTTLEITDELKENYQSGKSVEELLEPEFEELGLGKEEK